MQRCHNEGSSARKGVVDAVAAEINLLVCVNRDLWFKACNTCYSTFSGFHVCVTPVDLFA